MARDNSIYGADETSMAERIASDALRPSGAKEDFWGSTFDQEARSKGNADDNPTAKAKDNNGSDSRAKTAGNHGKQD